MPRVTRKFLSGSRSAAVTTVAFATVALSLSLAGPASARGVHATVKPLRSVNGVACKREGTTTSAVLDIYTYSCGNPLGRSYTISISIQREGNAFGGSNAKSDVKVGRAVSSTRSAAAGHASVIVIASRLDGKLKVVGKDAAATAKRLARLNARETK